MSLFLIFFLMGLASEFTYARWTQKLVEGSKESVLWSCLWGICNVYFLLELASSQDFTLGWTWVLGVMLGTIISLKPQERKYEYIWTFKDTDVKSLNEETDFGSLPLEGTKVRLADYTREKVNSLEDRCEELETKVAGLVVYLFNKESKHGKRKVRKPRVR